MRDLMDSGAYPHPCERIELIETHISWVLLTGDFAYKLKKPVRYSFLNFSTLELREHFCREELRCNRIFAAQLYLAVVPVYRHPNGSINMGGSPAPEDVLLEWAVKMRQFDRAAQLDRLLEHDAVNTAMMARFGGELAEKHAALPQQTNSAHEAEQRIIGPAEDNFSEIATTGLQLAHEALLGSVHKLSSALGQRLMPRFSDRFSNGYVRECHGDLHLSNLALIDGRVTAFDCLEFNPKLRWIDTMSDVAFLFMDCHERGRVDLAYAFLDGYLDTSGDYGGCEVLGYFAAYRSVVRAKVAALRWEQERSEETETRFVKHLAWAGEWLKRPRGTLVLMCGLSGAGKSYAAERLVPLLPAIRLRSDVARKTLAGLSAQARSDSPVGGGLYNPSRSNAVFEHLANVTEALLSDGDNVIIDATFIERYRRDSFMALAKRLNVTAWIVYCNAPINVLRDRIKDRTAKGTDASEATLQILDLQLTQFEPPCSPEPVIELDTGTLLSTDNLAELAKVISA